MPRVPSMNEIFVVPEELDDERPEDPYARDAQGNLVQPGTRRARPNSPTVRFRPDQLPMSGKAGPR